MAEDPGQDRWLVDSRERLARVHLGPQAREVGRVEHYSDGMARVSGLRNAALDEMLLFDGRWPGFVLALDSDMLDAVVLDAEATISVGSEVGRRGDVVRVPVGPSLLGRVVDPLGRPLDAGDAVEASESWPVERPAPAIIERAAVTEPVVTGLLVVDALFALGRGQRELIIGDRATGKTSLAVDAIIAQRDSDIVCVYVSVGQRAAATQQVIDMVRAHGAPERAIFVVAPAASAPGLQWIAPFAGFTIAEWFRDNGRHAMIVIDDLTKHAVTHRELALLSREPPGREAYPGDVFYLHARLLERAAKLSAERGGGSLTALPIAETDAGNLSGYIPTNLISITDGQIVLDSRLAAANQRPAVDVGLSVSRVGGKTQNPALRMAAGRLRLDYAQFLELEMFTRFGGLSDTRVKAQMTRGARIRALLAQPRLSPLRLVDEVALLVALEAGVLDEQAAEILPEVKRQVARAVDEAAPGLAASLAESGVLGAEQRQLLVEAVRALLATAAAAQGGEKGP